MTDEQRELRDLVRKFVRDEIIPVAGHFDRTGEFPWDIIKKAHATGLVNVDIPVEYGSNLTFLLMKLNYPP